jgi:hypothetical protein
LNREHYGDKPPWSSVSYQRFFTTITANSRCFRVKTPTQREGLTPGEDHQEQAAPLSRGDYMATTVLAELADLEDIQCRDRDVVSNNTAKSQVSPWLERTRWTRYLEGVRLGEAAALIGTPDHTNEPILAELIQAIDRLVEVAYTSVCEDKVNFFGQRRITSFLPQREVYSRPLIFKLQQSTYRQYKQSWKKLLAFVCRTSTATRRIRFRHCLTTRQTASLDSLIALGSKQVANPSLPTHSLDRACLDFCVSLLDHRLTGDIFESAVVGFLAVLGIDEANGVFHEAQNFTPKLSGFIKITQLLVLQSAVYAAEDGLANNPLDALDKMHETFMMLDTSTPFAWILSLRSFGKQIRDSTTSLGYIQWSEDA